MARLLNASTRNPRVLWLSALFCLGVAANLVLQFYYAAHEFHTLDAASGHIHRLSHFGYVAYLTQGEDRLLDIAEMAPFVFLIAAMLVSSRDLIRSGREQGQT
jgi:hypothetical protein